MDGMTHPSGIRQEIVDKVVARRGRLHAFPELMPPTTALIVVDLDVGTVQRMREHITDDYLRRVNVLAALLREQGGRVAWVVTPIRRMADNFRAVFGARAELYEQENARGDAGKVWPGLEVRKQDIAARKTGHSAFFPGKSDLHEQLRHRGITFLLIAGTQTSVCCEASARDAAELGYQVTLVSDLLINHRADASEATLATFFRFYGDVRPAAEIAGLISAPNGRAYIVEGYSSFFGAQ